MTNPLVPEAFKVPERFQVGDIVFRKLMYRDAELDYKAVMSSIEIIKKTRGGTTWPSQELTFVEDQIDLAWHQREFENRTSFAFTIMNLDETTCLGCMYLYPPGFRKEMSNQADVDMSFWVTQDAYDKGLYNKVYEVINNWLKTEWPFNIIVCTNNEIPS